MSIATGTACGLFRTRGLKRLVRYEVQVFVKDSETEALCHQPFCRLEQTLVSLALRTFLSSWSRHKDEFYSSVRGHSPLVPARAAFTAEWKIGFVYAPLFVHAGS